MSLGLSLGARGEPFQDETTWSGDSSRSFGQQVPVRTKCMGSGGCSHERGITLPARSLHSSENHLELTLMSSIKTKAVVEGSVLQEQETQQSPPALICV